MFKTFKFGIFSLFVICCLVLGISSAGAMSKMAGGNNGGEKGVYVGVFREGAPANMNYIKKFEADFGKKPAMVMWYEDWAQAFPKDKVNNVIAYGAVPHIVWEPWYWTDKNKIKLQDISSGKYDSYIQSWAKEIKALDQTVFLRVAHEFNIEGYPWGIINNGKDPAVYVKAYRHIVDIFNREGAKNVKWVWCFMNYSYPDESWNDWEAAYPGDKYVDWIGIDGYNWGKTQSWSSWQSVKYMFQEQVRRSRKLWPGKPIMIAEFGSADEGGDKGAWVKEIPGYLKSSMRDIKAVMFFDLKKEADWRVNSSAKAAAAFKSIMKDPIFLSSGPGLASLTVSPQVPSQKKVYAARAASPLKIDGSLADWDKSSSISMKDISYFKEGLSWGGPADLSGDAYLMWDDNNLYLAAVISDKIPLVNKQQKANVWNGDALEMVIGVDPNADKERTAFAGGDYQIGFSTGDGKGNPAIIWNWQRRREPAGSKIAVKKTAAPLGYVLEAMIPWEFFRMDPAPASGAKIAFDLAFDDADAAGERERQFIWNGDYDFYKDPSVWGILELK